MMKTKIVFVCAILGFSPVLCHEEEQSNYVKVEDAVMDIVLHGSERPLSGTDRIAILRTNGNHIRYTRASSSEECALKKFTKTTPVRRCELLERKICQEEYVLLRKLVKENCTIQKEFCEAFHRTQTVQSDQVVCEQKFEIDCDTPPKCEDTLSNPMNITDEDIIASHNVTANVVHDSNLERTAKSINITAPIDLNINITAPSENVTASTENINNQNNLTSSQSGCPESNATTCYPKRIAVCKSVPQMVTLTERKQKCKGDLEYRTTKMCFTHQDGTGYCKDFEELDCEDMFEMKVVNTEIGEEELDCTSTTSTGSEFCVSSHCSVVDNGTVCVRDSLPKEFTLKETVCEKCKEGRQKIRPVVELRNICRKKVENFCLDVNDVEEKWKKWCRPLKKKAATLLLATRRNITNRFRPKQQRKEEKVIEPAIKEESSNVTEQGVYHIEVSPGQWVTTSNDAEARELIEKQKTLEQQFEEVTDETKVISEEKTNEGSNEVAEEETTTEKGEEFRRRIAKCLFNPRSCRF